MGENYRIIFQCAEVTETTTGSTGFVVVLTCGYRAKSPIEKCNYLKRFFTAKIEEHEIF